MEFLQGVLVLAVVVVFDLTGAWESLRNYPSPRGRKLVQSSPYPGLAAPPQSPWIPNQVVGSQSPVFSRPAQDSLGPQQKQLLEAPVSLDWKYPSVPAVQRELAVDFQLRQPQTPSNTVAVQCGESRLTVEVKQDLFSNGQLIQPGRLTLGGCPVVGQDPQSGILIFEYELQACNSVLMVTPDELVYNFALTYTPEAVSGTPITRSDSAVVGVQCHYQRLQNVSSDSLKPAWIPYASTEVGEDVLVFSLSLMTDDWLYQRPSNVYFLGDVINIEASVKVYKHAPLRVFVDSCVATEVPDATALPRYSFIDNYGCFLDAKATGSSSHFMPQSQADKLQFQLEAFLFQETPSPFIYITCAVKATFAASPSDALHKSCSFANGWSAADGNHSVCGCCDSSCGPVVGGSPAADTFRGIQWEGNASLGPFVVKDQRKTGFQ